MLELLSSSSSLSSPSTATSPPGGLPLQSSSSASASSTTPSSTSSATSAIPPVIDMSTPETLERDFYAWLHWQPFSDGGGYWLEQSAAPPPPPVSGAPDHHVLLHSMDTSSPLPPIDLVVFGSSGQQHGSRQCISASLPSDILYGGSSGSPDDAYATAVESPDELHYMEGSSPESVKSSSSGFSSSCSSTETPLGFVPTRSSSSATTLLLPIGAGPATLTAEYCREYGIRGGSSTNASAGLFNANPTNTSLSTSARIEIGRNQLGRTYSPGLPLSMADREHIVQLWEGGWKICDISRRLCVTHSCVSKILNRYKTTGSVRPKEAKEGRSESPLVMAIRDYRARLGMCRQSEIREQLIADGICTRENAPSRSSINHILRTKLDIKKRRERR